jgi:hypothetical protein
MEVAANSKECPICGYEFAEYSTSMKWVALILALLFLLYFFLL